MLIDHSPEPALEQAREVVCPFSPNFAQLTMEADRRAEAATGAIPKRLGAWSSPRANTRADVMECEEVSASLEPRTALAASEQAESYGTPAS